MHQGASRGWDLQPGDGDSEGRSGTKQDTNAAAVPSDRLCKTALTRGGGAALASHHTLAMQLANLNDGDLAGSRASTTQTQSWSIAVALALLHKAAYARSQRES